MRTLLALACLATLLPAQEPTAGDIRALAANVRSYPAKFSLVAEGRAAVDALLAQVEHADPWVAHESRSALRWIVNYALEAAARVRQADRPSREAAEGEVVMLINTLAPWTGPERPAATRCFAAELLGETGAPGAIPPLSRMLPDDPVRAAAISALARIRDPRSTRVLLESLGAAPEAARREILAALAEKGDRSAVPAIHGIIEEGGPLLPEALMALGALGDASMLPALVPRVASGSDAEAAAAFDALLRIGARLGCTAAAAEVCAAALGAARTPKDRIRALAGLDRARHQAGLDAVRRALGDADPGVAAAATRAAVSTAETLLDGGEREAAAELIGQVLAGTADAAALVRALAGAGRLGDAGAIRAIRGHLGSQDRAVAAAAVAALRDIPGRSATEALIEALEGPARAHVVEALALRADRGAVPALSALARGGDGAAMRALGRIGDPAGAAALLEVLERGDAAAMDPLLAIGRASASSKGAEARGLYHRMLAMKAAPAVLSALTEVADRSSLGPVEKILGSAEGDTRSAAAACLAAIGSRLDPGTERDEIVRLWSRAAELGVEGLEEKIRALGERVEIVARDGRIDWWWVLGPWPAKERSDWSRAEAPESEISLDRPCRIGERDVTWRTLQGAGEAGMVDLDAALRPNDHVFAYAYAEIVPRRARDAVLRLGSDDGVVVWLNGEKIHEFLSNRGFAPDQDSVPVKLRAGVNTLLVKVCEIGGGWSFHARLEDEEGRPLRFRVR